MANFSRWDSTPGASRRLAQTLVWFAACYSEALAAWVQSKQDAPLQFARPSQRGTSIVSSTTTAALHRVHNFNAGPSALPLSVLERIREELRTGKGVIAAVDAGFSKAWWTIVDTHVTTVVSCCFLFLFGEGPVRGFAVTLVIGLIANVFTAVFVSKVIFDYELSGTRRMEALSI